MESIRICPCGSQIDYQACCGRYIDGKEVAPTAEALMRSRYTAYALRNDKYLLKTWYTEQRPEPGEHNPELHWEGLDIVNTEAGGEDDKDGVVEFVARYRVDGRYEQLHERSYFKRYRGRWYYVDGEDLAPLPVSSHKIGRNDPCPCGSGKKFKKCCGA